MATSYRSMQHGDIGPRGRNVGTNERRLSLLGGAAATLAGLSRGGLGGLTLAGLGAALLYRGGTGRCPINSRIGRNTARPDDPGLFETGRARAQEGAVMRASAAINRETGDLYSFWHDFSRMPEFMRYIQQVSPRGENRWHWVAELPMAGRIEWDAEITADEPNRRIAWRSVEGSDIETEGEVNFRRHPEGRGSDVHVEMRYRLASGMSNLAARLARSMSEQLLREDLRRFKQIMEAGEIARSGATTEAMSSQRLQ